MEKKTAKVRSAHCMCMSASALEEAAPLSIIHPAVLKPEIDFVREIVTQSTKVQTELLSVDAIILLLTSKSDFNEKLSKNFTKENIPKIEEITREK